MKFRAVLALPKTAGSTQPIYMRYHFFLHYGWFLQNLGKKAVRTNIHTTVDKLSKAQCMYNFSTHFQVLFFLFIVWMAFIIMNLLVGLTVTKIEELVKTGEKIQAIKRVEDIFGMAKMMKKFEDLKKMCGNHVPMLIMKAFDGEKTKKVEYQFFTTVCRQILLKSL